MKGKEFRDDQTTKDRRQAINILTLGHKGIYLINQVGFSGSFEESKRDVTYRNDPTIEGVSKIELLIIIILIITMIHV